MATIVASATGGNWNATTAWTGGVVPGASDDVQLTSTSGAITINVNSACRSLDCTGFTGTLTHSAAVTLSVGDATAGLSSIAMKTVAGMTYTIGSTTTSVINFISTSATQQDLTTGGKTWPTYTVNGAGSSYRLTDANTISNAGTVTLTAGTFNTNGQTCSWGNLVSNGSSTRTLTLGASAITISGTSWNTSTTTGLTFNPNTSSITHVSGNANFQTGGLTFNNATLGGNAGTNAYSGASTFANLTVTGFASGRLAVANNIVVTGTFTMASSSSTSMSQLQSSQRGIQRTITAAVTALSNHNIQDILGAGAATWDATNNVGDMGGNSNITFSSPVTRYWVATAGGNYNATSSWSASSGGASGASIPLPHDTVVFDANSITSASRTITINVQCCPTLDFTNLTNTPTISTVLTNGNIYIKGSIAYSSAVVPSGTTGLIMVGRTGTTMKSGTVTILSGITIDAPASTISLAGDFSNSLVVTLTQGTLDANGFNLTTSAISASGTLARTLTMGSGTWTLTAGTGNVWNTATDTNLTLNANTSTIAITETGASSKTFNASSTLQTYNNVTITSGGAGAVIFSGVLSFNDFTCTGGSKTISFTTASKTIRGNFNVRGTAGNLISLTSQTNGSAVNLNKTSGTVSSDYLSVKDSNANGGARWFAGANSTNVSGNSGWVFTVANFLPTHTTDTNKRKAATATHTTDALKQMKRGHTTDALKTTAGSAREMRRSHTTDVAIIKARGTKTHSTDANTRIPQLRTHNTNANKRLATTKIHTTSSYLRKISQAKFVQKIEIIPEVSNVSSAANTYTEIPFGLLQLDASAFDGDVTFYFEGSLRNTGSAGSTAYAELYNKTDSVSVTGSEFTEVDPTPNNLPRRHRTGPLALSGDKLYVVRTKHTSSGTLSVLGSARLVVIQQGNITKTQIHQPLGVEGTTTSTSSTNILTGSPKFLYEAAKYDGTISITHEGVINQTASPTSEVYDVTSSSIVTSSAITSGITTWAYRKSGAITLTDGHVYQLTSRVASGTGTFESNKLVFTITGGFTKFLAYVATDKRGIGHGNGTNSYPSGFSDWVDYVQNYDPAEYSGANVILYHEANISITPSTETAYSNLALYDFNTTSLTDIAGSLVSYTGSTTPQRLRSGSITIPSASDLAAGITASTGTNTAKDYAAFLVVELNQLTNITHTISHGTSASKKIVPTKTHTTGAATHRSGTPSHTTSSYIRQAGITRAHTADANKRTGGVLRTFTTDSLKRARLTPTHTADANKRKSITPSHSTDALKKSIGLLRTHTTNSLKRKQFTLVNNTDSLKRRSPTVTHTTGSYIRKGNSKSPYC
jgi:hypothetical protein